MTIEELMSKLAKFPKCMQVKVQGYYEGAGDDDACADICSVDETLDSNGVHVCALSLD